MKAENKYFVSISEIKVSNEISGSLGETVTVEYTKKYKNNSDSQDLSEFRYNCFMLRKGDDGKICIVADYFLLLSGLVNSGEDIKEYISYLESIESYLKDLDKKELESWQDKESLHDLVAEELRKSGLQEDEMYINCLVMYADKIDLSFLGDTNELDDEHIKYIKAGIYAKHGLIFDDLELQNFFSKQDYYTPRIRAKQWSDDVLNDFEITNINRLEIAENRHEELRDLSDSIVFYYNVEDSWEEANNKYFKNGEEDILLWQNNAEENCYVAGEKETRLVFFVKNNSKIDLSKLDIKFYSDDIALEERHTSTYSYKLDGKWCYTSPILKKNQNTEKFYFDFGNSYYMNGYEGNLNVSICAEKVLIKEFKIHVRTSLYSKDEDRDYILPYSDIEYIYEDLSYLSKWELKIARNEIFARYGYIFEDNELNQYFQSKSWYIPRYTKDEFNVEWFNEYEKSNIDYIKMYEKN